MVEELVKVDVTAIPLRQAVLCPNCDCISDSPHDNCLICGSPSLLPLARVLGETRRTILPAATPAVEEIQDRVLVLVPPAPHRRRKRMRATV